MTAINLQQETIASLAAAMAAGTLTARALTEHCLARSREIDPKINALLEINPQALEDADRLDRERGQAKLRGPVHGLPILVKDNIDTAGPMMTTAGSLALLGHRAPADAFVVKRLRQAGAIILGKTNLSEWANFRSTRSSSGWSSRGGQTRNPYALDRSPGGSSSGSAAAVAAGLCVAAIGTETDGSIITPSAMTSIVGIKPSVGLVSRSGIIPISHSQDTAGPMARKVEDAALLLKVISGLDAEDPSTAQAQDNGADLQTFRPSSNHLQGARIGLARNYCGFHEGVDQIIDASLKTLREAGATVIDDLELTPASEIRVAEEIVMSVEFKVGLKRYLSQHPTGSDIRCLADIIKFNDTHHDTVMPYFQQEIFLRSEKTTGLQDHSYLQALELCRQLSREQGIDRLIAAHQLDAIIAPSACTPWVIDWVNGDHRSGGSSCPAAAAGYPNITVPAGYVFGLPVGLSFFSGLNTEAKLIALAGAFEQATQVRIPPEFSPHAND